MNASQQLNTIWLWWCTNDIVSRSNCQEQQIAEIYPYGQYYQTQQFSYYNNLIMLQFYNYTDDNKLYDIFLGIYNISSILNETIIMNTKSNILKPNNTQIPLCGGINLISNNPNILYTLSSLKFTENNVVMNAFFTSTYQDQQLFKLKVMDEIQLFIWVDEEKAQEQQKNLNTTTNIKITAQNILYSQSMHLQVYNTWIDPISNTKNNINKNKFPLWGFLLIAIGVLILVFVIIYLWLIKKNNNKNKEEYIFVPEDQFELVE